ncbi:hypothetical protein ACIGXM_02755 [Kitasatospora sp. NPDC052896]|uniref:hypothetical protein n=1 Tax=Kitasatospora sp. NPDC052896 TaxID=3364061 RepID=UPI0037C6E235
MAQFASGFCWWAYGVLFVCCPLLWKLDPQHERDATGTMHSFGIQIAGSLFDTLPRALLINAVGLLALWVPLRLARHPLVADHLPLTRPFGPSAGCCCWSSSRRPGSTPSTRQRPPCAGSNGDLHDGAQTRLVALGMRLGRAERLLAKGNVEQPP